MKTLFVFASALAMQAAVAQKTESLKDFKTIDIDGDLKVQLVRGSENKLVYNGNQEEISVNNEDGNLSLGGDGSVTLYYKTDPESIVAGSDSTVTGTDELKGKMFTLTAGSDSVIDLNFNVNTITVTTGSDAKVTLKGKCKAMTATVGSDGHLNTQKLTAEDVSVTVGSDGQATIFAEGTVTATVGSDGQATIYGNPKKVNEVKSGGAQITVK